MKCFDLVSHALRDVRAAHAQLDVQAASATLLLIAFFAVVGAALANEISRAITEEMSRSRFFYGTFTIEGHRGHLTAIEPSLQALVDDQSSGFAAVSTIYAGVLSKLSGLEPVGADRKPYSPNSVVIRSDDPLVTPGFGLSLRSPQAFAPTDRIENCWRFAFVMTRRALLGHHGFSAEMADWLLTAPRDEMPSISFRSTEILHARNRSDAVVLAPFVAKPERVIDQENHAFPDYLLYWDAGLALAQLDKAKWQPTIFRQFRKGLRDDCDVASPLAEFKIQPWKRDELRKISNFPVAGGKEETLVVSPNDDGYAEIPDRESVDMRALKVERFLVWVDDYLSLAAFQASDAALQSFVRDARVAPPAGVTSRSAERLKFSLPQRPAIESFLRAHNLAQSLFQVGVAILGFFCTFLTASLGFSFVNRRRADIGLLRSQGARKRTVFVLYELEIVVIALVGSAIGTALAVGALYLGVADQLLANLGGLDETLAKTLHSGAEPASIGASTLKVMGAVTVFAALGGALPAIMASRTDPIAELQTV